MPRTTAQRNSESRYITIRTTSRPPAAAAEENKDSTIAHKKCAQRHSNRTPDIAEIRLGAVFGPARNPGKIGTSKFLRLPPLLALPHRVVAGTDAVCACLLPVGTLGACGGRKGGRNVIASSAQPASPLRGRPRRLQRLLEVHTAVVCSRECRHAAKSSAGASTVSVLRLM